MAKPSQKRNPSPDEPAVTDFQARVYAAARRIPAGKVVSYSALASAIDCRSARVVGQALRLCPFDDVPCHRVVAAGLRLGGFGGRQAGPQAARKKKLLLAEGVRFDSRGRIDAECELRDSPALRRLLGDKPRVPPVKSETKR